MSECDDNFSLKILTLAWEQKTIMLLAVYGQHVQMMAVIRKAFLAVLYFFLWLQEIFEAGPALRLAEDGCFQNGVVWFRNEEEGLFRAGDARIDKFARHNRIVM